MQTSAALVPGFDSAPAAAAGGTTVTSGQSNLPLEQRFESRVYERAVERIKEKDRNGNGKLVYALPGAADLRRIEDLATALRRWATGMTPAGQLLVITTRNGLAAPLADAIDEAGLADVAGTVAGENTIFVAARDGMSGTDLEEQFHHHAGGEG